MSGKRQHFIPRFLQEGFASHATADNAFTWVYRKNAEPFSSNIGNVGVEGCFYADRDDMQADNLITDAEGSFATLVHKLRTTAPAAASDSAIPELIAHLEVRTRHLRQGLSRAGDYLVSRLLDFLADERAFLSYFERKLRSDPSILRQSFARELADRGLPQGMLEPLLQLAAPFLPVAIEQLGAQLPALAEALRPVAAQAVKEASKSGQIRALKTGVSPVAKVHRYKELAYMVLETADTRLILGDSVLVFHIDSAKPYKTFLEGDDTLHAVYLPLGPSRLLVGSSYGPRPAPAGLREAIARCSLEHFIAAEDSEANRQLQEQIGEDAALISTAELEDIVSDIMIE